MKVFRLNEAIARCERLGKKVRKKELAAKLWANSTPAAQQVNMTNLAGGRTKKVDIEWVSIICEELQCDANYLFGLSNE